jgi:sigma-B regulation protein RsbU (phosphoserine phosphatase)
MTISYKRKIKSIKRKEAEKREKERIESEINTARETQMNLLPNNDFETSFLKIWANCKPAFEVGGDYYDYFLFGEDNLKLFLTTVDISGKSMQAAVSVALVAGMTANFRNYKEISPGKFLSNLNLAFRSKRPTKRQFAAMTAAVFDFNDMRLIYSNSGQPDIFYLRDGKISYLEPNKMRIPVGAMSDIQYDENSHDMMSGDIYLFISDGVIEAMDVKKRMFGYERINDILKSNSTLVEEIGLKISDKVSKFSAGTIQYDDYTIILLQIL